MRGNSWNLIPDGVRTVFHKRAKKESVELSRDAAIVVQAIKTLGKDGIDEQILKKLSEYLVASSCQKIIK